MNIPHRMTDMQLLMYAVYMLCKGKTHIPDALTHQLWTRAKLKREDWTDGS